MKILANRIALLEALKLVGGAVPARTPKPVLSCVRLIAEKGAVVLTATDLEVVMSQRITQVDVSDGGLWLMPHAKGVEILSAMHDDTVTLKSEDETTVQVIGAISSFRIFSFPVADYPVTNIRGDVAETRIDAAALRNAIDRVQFAASRETGRYAISGVYLEVYKDSLRLVATDCHALAKTDCALTRTKGKERGHAVIPLKAIQLLRRSLDGAVDVVAMQWGGNEAVFHLLAGEDETPWRSIKTGLVEGTFPPYDQLFDKAAENTIKVSLPRHRLLDALAQASTMVNSESMSVKLEFNADKLTISSRAAELGEAKVEVAAPYAGEPLKISFRPEQITPFLKAADTDEITMQVGGARSPGLLRAGSTYQYVVMPTQI